MNPHQGALSQKAEISRSRVSGVCRSAPQVAGELVEVLVYELVGTGLEQDHSGCPVEHDPSLVQEDCPELRERDQEANPRPCRRSSSRSKATFNFCTSRTDSPVALLVNVPWKKACRMTRSVPNSSNWDKPMPAREKLKTN